MTNNLAVLTPYQITFRSFTPEVAEVLARFASSPHGFVVKSINVQPAGASAASPDLSATPGAAIHAAASMDAGRSGGVPPQGASPASVPGRGGLQKVSNEQLLRVTIVVELVKLFQQGKRMDFVKKHYEKILLTVVLLGLVGALVFLPFLINKDQDEVSQMTSEVFSPKVAPLPALSLARQTNVFERDSVTLHA